MLWNLIIFSQNFLGQISVGVGGGEQALVQKGKSVRGGGGIGQYFSGWGTPGPPGKKPCGYT